MKRFCIVAAIVVFGFVFSTTLAAQTDDIRQATGLPIPIGAPVIYGQVRIRGLAANDPKPSIYVSLLLSGAQIDRMRTNERAYYYFLRSPRDGATLVFEVNNNEVGRVVLSAGVGSSVRRDIEIDWQTARQAGQSGPGVVSVKAAYARNPENDKAFDKAMAAAKAKRPDDALTLFKQIVDRDPKDFVAWTEIGTLYFGISKFADAESAYGQALVPKPDFMPALMNLGKLHLSQKQADKATVIFQKAAASEPTSAEAFHYLGEAYLQTKQGSKAVVALNEAIRLAPVAKAEIHLRLAALYNAAGAKDRAAGEYKIFLDKVPAFAQKEKLEKYIRENSK